MSSEDRSHEIFFESDSASASTEDAYVIAEQQLSKAKENALAKGSVAAYNRLSNSIIKNEIDVSSSYDTFRQVNRNELHYGAGNEARWGIGDTNNNTGRGSLLGEKAACESVHEKLTRIKLELADVMGEIDVLQSNTASGGASNEGSGGGGVSKDVWSYLQEEAQNLVAQAERGSEQAESLSDALTAAALTPSPAPPPPQALSMGDSNSNNGRSSNSSSRDYSGLSLLQLEQRVHVLETLLGCGPSSGLSLPAGAVSGGGGGDTSSIAFSTPVVTLLMRVEKKLASLDAAALEGLRKKIPAVKREMDNLLLNTVNVSNNNNNNNNNSSSSSSLKGTTKATATTTSSNTTTTGLKLLEAAVIIESLYTKSVSYDSVLDDIPHLVTRLKTLQGLHQEQSGYSSRLSSLEQLMDHLSADVVQNNAVMEAVAEEMRGNLATFDNNITQMERRLAAIANA